MILVVFVFLSCVPLLHSATYKNSSDIPVCKERFSCGDIGQFAYPFHQSNDPRCGLIGITCNPTGDKLQIGGREYEIFGKFSGGRNPHLLVHNGTFENLVKHQSCEALMHNFTSPDPLLYSVSIKPLITVFKCSKNTDYTSFRQPTYRNYSLCNHKFYVNPLTSNATVPIDLPNTCQVIQLPMKQPGFAHEPVVLTNMFSLLSSSFPISFHLSDTCKACLKNGSHCRSNNGHVECLEVKKVKTGRGHLILVLPIAGSAFILVLSFVMFVIWRRCKSNPFSYAEKKSSDLEDSRVFGVPVFTYNDLKDATQNFDPSQELGDGGFGAVYYGKLQDGRQVAVKRLYDHNYKRVQHFMNEVEILTRLRHPNLVVLYGCTSKQSRELLLVYEYIPNGTVADHLHGDQADPSILTWPMRMNIAIETASALVYLHASEIIHRDVKTNNILLDHNYCVKVADFGLSRLLPNNVTHVSTTPQGTPGYVDPQYHQRYQLTDKSDVYSFGVVLIELISSMVAVDLNRPQDEISLANLALNRIQGRAIEQLIDPVLLAESDSETMNMIILVAELAFRCLQFDSEMRPTMNEVLDVLTNIQAVGRTDPDDDSCSVLKNVNPTTHSENSDVVVLLKDFLRSPVSVNSEWPSENTASSTISGTEEKLPVNYHIST